MYLRLCIGFFLFFSSLSAQEFDLCIPVVNMQDYEKAEEKEAFLNTLYEAMTTVGFFAVRHTGVDPAVVKRAYEEAQKFFKQDLREKLQCFDPLSGGQRGFVPGEIAKGTAIKDRKEFYHVGNEEAFLPNIWPPEGDLQTAFMQLYQELEKYIIPLQEAILASINVKSSIKLPLDLLSEATKEGDCLLRALYYPAFSKEEDTPLWAAAHTDIDLLAILPFATEKGLQVEIDGHWLNVVVPEDAFIVNVGDMLENLTNGLLKSARHRVMALEPEKERFSMVLFVHPSNETSLDPLEPCITLTGGKQLYANGTRKEFLWERLLELNLAPHLLIPYSQTGHIERQIEYGRQSPQVLELLIQNQLASPQALETVK